jgi:PIN domain nuclease of toxin-antitoxin system
MRLLLDTHILITLARRDIVRLGSDMDAAISSTENLLFASAASFWEIVIKTRLRKLDPSIALEDLPDFFEAIGLNLLVINHRHVVHAVDPEPPTRDPFDRLLLAQCAVEGLQFVTLDRALSGHPLAWTGPRR